MSIDLREKLRDLSDAIDRQSNAGTDNPPSFLGKAVNGGAMPTGQGRIYLFNPVTLDGPEAEGEAATITADTTRQIPVLALGSRQIAVGDLYVCRSVGGRWVTFTGNNLNYCNQVVPACGRRRYAMTGTVTDSINGPQPLTYNYASGAWYSAWLPYSSNNVLQSGPNSNPCSVGHGSSYYFHELSIHPTTGKPVATLVLPGRTCTNSSGGGITAGFFKYQNTSTFAPYPALLGSPASWTSSSFQPQYTGDPSECDPLTVEAVWPTTGTVGPYLPMAGATYSVPLWTEPPYGFSCGTPCPLPRKDLTLSWTNVTSGNGSGTLVYDSTAKTWAMACTGGLRADLSMVSGGSVAFNLRRYGSPSDCSGAVSLWSYSATLTLDTDYTCEPLLLTFRPRFTTQALYLAGYRTFAITE